MLHDARKKTKKKIKQRLIFCRARTERHRLQKHDKLFRNHDNHHFHLLQAKRRECTKLFANGRLATNLQELLSCWKEHFAGLGRSRSDENDVVKAADDDIPVLHAIPLSEMRTLCLTPKLLQKK